MTTTRTPAAMSAPAAAGRGPRARAVACVLLALAAMTTAGCGMATLRSATRLLPGLPKSRPASPETIAELKEQATLDPTQPYWPYDMARRYVAGDSLPQAEAALKTSLQRDASFVPALSLLSSLYYETGRHQEAASLLEAARTRSASRADGFPPALAAGLALHYDALDRSDLAQDAVSPLPRNPSDGTAAALAYIALRGQNPDVASEAAESAVEKDPGSAVNQNNYGITRLRAGDPRAARRAFMTAIELDPGLPGPYYNLAILEKFYLLQDRAAARWFKLYAQRSADDPDGLKDVFGNSEAPARSEEDQP